VVRVYAIDKESGQLNTCPSLSYTPGSGPRHGLFWSSRRSHRDGPRIQNKKAPLTMLYTVSELSRHFHAFEVSYLPSGCLGFHETQDFVPYPNGEIPDGASLAELQQAGSDLYASIRSDRAFSGNDSIATLSRSKNGTVTFQELTSAHGLVPRTFVINKAGTLVAIGDQSTSNVAIVSRDPASGKLGDLVANIQVGEPGKPGTSTGLSSVIWAE
jgi:6-phosphogluconolactonase (cycloisomerase 2 family)